MSPGGQFAVEIRRIHRVYSSIVRTNPEELHVREQALYDLLFLIIGTEGRPRRRWLDFRKSMTYCELEKFDNGERRRSIAALPPVLAHSHQRPTSLRERFTLSRTRDYLTLSS